MSSKDFYSTLGVAKNATDEQIKKAYKKLAFKYHPDRNKGDKKSEEKFKEINEAYQILGDSERRSQYDTFGSAGFEGGGFPGGGFPGGGFPGGRGFPDLEDLMNDFFGQATGRRSSSSGAQPKGRDISYELILEFEEAVNGVKKNVSIRRAKNYKTCNACDGTGQSHYSQGFLSISRTCGSCGGVGAFPEDTENATESVTVPPGVDTGTRLRLKNKGDIGINSGASGDLYVTMIVKDHPFFSRQEENIICEVPITVPQAIMGGTIDIPTLDGKSELKILPGTQPGQVMRLRGKGIKRLRDSGYGDLFVKLNIAIPSKISAKQRKLMEEFQQEIERDAKNPVSDYLNKIKEFFN